MQISTATTSRSRLRAKAGAFTIVELSLVLVILGVMAASVALRSHVIARQAELSELAAQFGEFDRLTRFYAMEQDRPLRIVIDMSLGTVRRTDVREGDCLGEPLQCGGNCRIARLLVRNEELRPGSASITCSRRGLTPTYAVLLEDTAGRRQWLLFAGLTGEMTKADDEDQVREIMEAASRRADAR